MLINLVLTQKYNPRKSTRFCDRGGDSDFSIGILEGDVDLAKKFMKDKNVYKFADLIPCLDYSAKDFYSFIASNICNTESKSNLNNFLLVSNVKMKVLLLCLQMQKHPMK
jgi:hypothetical protein